MTSPLEAAFRKLLRAPPSQQRRLGAAVVALQPDWTGWTSVFNPLHGSDPAEEVRVAGVLRREAERADEDVLVAHLTLIEARGMHRSGSPVAAAERFAESEARLRAAKQPALAAKAAVLRVDALAHAGQIQEALRVADRAQRQLSGADSKAWRAVLQINRGNALRLIGDVDAAVRAFDRAARRFDALGDPNTAAIARTNAGVALLDVDVRRARKRLEQALATFEEQGHEDMALDVRENLACADIRAGRIGDAIRALHALIAEHEARKLPRRKAGCHLDLSEALQRAGDAEAAEQEALQAARAFAEAGAVAERVEALQQAAAAVASSRPARAAQHLRTGARAATKAGREGIALRCTLLAEDVALRRGKAPDRVRLRQATQRARKLGLDLLADECSLLLGQASLAGRRVADARRMFSQVLDRRATRPWVRAAAQTGLARCEAERGALGRAIQRLRRVTEFLDEVRADLHGAWLRATFVLQELDPYLTRVDLLLRRGRRPDRAEAERLLDALAARRFLEQRTPAPVRTATRRRLEQIYDRLARTGDSERRGVGLTQTLEAEARRWERRVARAWRSSERSVRAAGHVETARPSPVRLRAHHVAVHLWVHAGQIRALVRRGDEVDPSVTLGSVAAIRHTHEKATFHADRLVYFGERVDPRAFHASMERLAEQLLTPLAPDTWPDSVKWIIDPAVPDLPWELLPWHGRALCQQFALLRVPALRVRTRRRRVGVGTCFVAADDASLPALAAEGANLPRGTQRLLGAAADRKELASALEARRVVHIAGHGLYAPDAPALGGVRVHDGWFAAVDVPRHVAADLVVLSSCRTGHGEGPEGAAWGALPMALLAAGARAVVWTASDLDDSTAAQSMASLHRHLPNHGPAEAFGRAIASHVRSHGSVARVLPFRLSGTSA